MGAKYDALAWVATRVSRLDCTCPANPQGQRCLPCLAKDALAMPDDAPPAATGRVVRFAVAFDKAGNWSIYGGRGIPRRDMLAWAVSQVGVEAETRMANMRLPETDDLVAEIATE